MHTNLRSRISAAILGVVALIVTSSRSPDKNHLSGSIAKQTVAPSMLRDHNQHGDDVGSGAGRNVVVPTSTDSQPGTLEHSHSSVGAVVLGGQWAWAELPRLDARWAQLSEANVRSASLNGANFRGAFLGGANLYRADLSGADLATAQVSIAQLQLACGNQNTQLPTQITLAMPSCE